MVRKQGSFIPVSVVLAWHFGLFSAVERKMGKAGFRSAEMEDFRLLGGRAGTCIPPEVHLSGLRVYQDLRTKMRFFCRNSVVPIQSLRQFCCGKFEVNYAPRFCNRTRGGC